MKIWKTGSLLLLLVCFFTGGCVRESFDGCPEGGYDLVFFYPGNGTTDIFPSKIDHVRMLVYDPAGSKVQDSSFSRDDLQQYQGARLDLAAGSYTVVCWGNMAGYSVLSETDPIAEGRLYQSQFLSGSTIENFDSLYYGKQDIVIEQNESGTDVVTFVSAHINMEIHIEGYEGRITTRAEGQGIIELQNISVGYDFDMDLTPEISVMYPLWQTNESGEEIVSRFNLLRFDNDTAIVINIRSSDDGGIIGSVILSEFLEENGITVEGVNEITVPIYITFDEFGIRVSVDPWNTEPVTPIP